MAGAFLVASAALPVAAAWVHDAMVNEAVCTQGADQHSVRVVADGTGGWIVAWVDERSGGNPAIYAQRLGASGARAWATDGVLAFQSYGFFTQFELAPDGQGGAFLAVVDSHDATQYHVYLQKLSAAGARVAGTGGVVAVTGTGSAQVDPSLARSEDGAAVVAFVDSRSAGGDIYAQRMAANGSLTWGAGGAAVCALAAAQHDPVVAPDGSGGAFVFWEDDRDLGANGSDIYGQRLSSVGVQQWTAAGAVVSTAFATQRDLAVSSDGMGGALVAWVDERDAGANGSDVYAQRLNGSGTARWFNNGRAVCAVAGPQYGVVVTNDPYGGAYVAWTDGRADAWSGEQVYAQALAGDGLARWAVDGQPAGPAAGNQSLPGLAATDLGSLSLAWTDQRTGGSDIRAQRFDYAGAAQWGAAGLLVCGAAFTQEAAVPAAGAAGEILVAWDDQRLAQDIHAQRVDRSGWLGDPAPALVSVADRPGDQGGEVRLTWGASWLDAWGQPGLATYHVLNRRPGSKAVGTGPAILNTWLADGWTEVAQVPPLQLTAYAANVPTYGDWTPTAQPLTEFMVIAESGAFLWASGILSGYSQDNLSPGAPLDLVAETDNFDVLLAWTPSGQDDSDLHHYNLYRSQDPAFTPGPATQLSEASVTSYAEVRVPQGHWYFRVTAVDIHGNEGLASNVAGMLSLVPVDGRLQPGEVAVSAAAPNPFNPVTEIRCELPSAGTARVVVHDLAGRVVRRLLDGPREAGPFTVDWDGRDDAGRQLPSGVYFARLTALGSESVLKLVLAK